MTSTAILYYLCKSEDVQTGFFGNADQCAGWYLTYGGAEYRIYPKLKNRFSSQHGSTAEDVLLDEGNGPVWYVAFKSADDYLFREAPFTVVGKDQGDACHSLLRHVVESRLLNTVDGDDDFYMVSAEKILPSLIRLAEMRELYNRAGQPETGEDDEVVKWFCNADHSKEALLEMVDMLSSRLRLPLTAAQAMQIKKQIVDAVIDQDMASRTKVTYSAIPVFC